MVVAESNVASIIRNRFSWRCVDAFRLSVSTYSFSALWRVEVITSQCLKHVAHYATAHFTTCNRLPHSMIVEPRTQANSTILAAALHRACVKT